MDAAIAQLTEKEVKTEQSAPNNWYGTQTKQ